MARKFDSLLGKKIPEPGAHMPHVAVGILRKKRREKHGEDTGGSKVKPMKEYYPYVDDTKPT